MTTLFPHGAKQTMRARHSAGSFDNIETARLAIDMHALVCVSFTLESEDLFISSEIWTLGMDPLITLVYLAFSLFLFLSLSFSFSFTLFFFFFLSLSLCDHLHSFS